VRIHKLFFQLLGDPMFKAAFARALARHYEKLAAEVWPKKLEFEATVLQFSVQLFTVAGLTDVVISEMNLFRTLFRALRNGMASAVSGGVFNPEHPTMKKRSYWRVVHDVRYVV
jgi:hypothetical protein